MSRVDVVIPCYKYAHYLRECVSSVLTQESVEVRVLIIDDCSPDETPDVGRQLAAEDPRVGYRRHEVNRGHIATYNEGLLGWASGDYCVLLSADDLLLPGSLARATQVLDRHPETAFAHGRVVRIRNGHEVHASVNASGSVEIVNGIQWIQRTCSHGTNHIASPEVVVRRTVQQQAGGYRADLPHTGDLEMWLRLATYGSVAILDSHQALYRIHDTNMHQRIANTQLRALRQFWAAYDALFQSGRLEAALGSSLSSNLRINYAGQALEAASNAFDAGDSDASTELLRFASEVCHESKAWRESSRMRWKLRLGTSTMGLVRRIRAVLSPRAAVLDR